MTETARQVDQKSLAERLGGVRVGTRNDLHVTRHVFRGEPAYVVQDPITLQGHRLSVDDYNVFVALDRSRSLGEVLEELVAEGMLDEDQDEQFYAFVMQLHMLGFLSLPVNNDKLLYSRHVQRKQMERRQKVTGILFLRVPLVNPDAFLERTVRLARPLFSRWALVLWVLLMCASGYTALMRGDELFQPLQGVLAAKNLPLMWITLVGLKVFHEFGHAYACKRFGGYVPEMGAYFILFTPCAYVDATACWGFSRKRDRLVVCLAGMYVESFFAMAALFVWASTAPGGLRDAAYNVMLLSGVVTVLFNINPLMRYDGYYVLSDWLEIPNLRARASLSVNGMLKRVFLSVGSGAQAGGRRLRAILVGFGLAAAAYRITIMAGIAAVVASKLPVIGLGVAGLLLGTTVAAPLVRSCRYLLFSKEVQPVRFRAAVACLTIAVGLPSLIMFLPFPQRVLVAGVVKAADTVMIRARESGVVEAVGSAVGHTVSPGDLLLRLDEPDRNLAVQEAEAAIHLSELRLSAFEASDPVLARQEAQRLEAHRRALALEQERLSRLDIRTDRGGVVTQGVDHNAIGQYVDQGQPVVEIASGAWQIRAVLDELEFASAKPEIGQIVNVRLEQNPSLRVQGRIVEIAPMGSRRVRDEALTHVGGGNIAVDPASSVASQSYFAVVCEIATPDNFAVLQGTKCNLQFAADSRSIGSALMRQVTLFTNRLAQG